jgi:hypothetical protein
MGAQTVTSVRERIELQSLDFACRLLVIVSERSVRIVQQELK